MGAMTSTGRLEARIALPDIARLAGVQRPVVSMWRRRPKVRGVILPFPDPVGRDGAQELFDTEEVLSWLERTGARELGGSPVGELARLERVVAGDDLVVLEALWALMALTGRDLAEIEGDDILDLADAADPDDVMILGELEAAGEALVSAIARAVAMSEAAYGPAGAWRRARRSSSVDTAVVSVLAPLVGPSSASGHEVLQMMSAKDLDLVVPIVSALPEGTPVALGYGGADDAPVERCVGPRSSPAMAGPSQPSGRASVSLTPEPTGAQTSPRPSEPQNWRNSSWLTGTTHSSSGRRPHCVTHCPIPRTRSSGRRPPVGSAPRCGAAARRARPHRTARRPGAVGPGARGERHRSGRPDRRRGGPLRPRPR